MAHQMFARISSSAASVPPLRVDILWPFAVVLSIFVGLTLAGWEEARVFVLVSVTAQALVLWRNLPRAARDLGSISSGHARLLVWPVIIMLALIALQLVLASPLFTQRLVSAGCIFVLVIMLFGVRREKQILGAVMKGVRSVRPLSSPVPLMRVNALFAAALLCLNELLIASGSLTVWMSAMVLMLLVLRSAYWFVILLVTPDEGGKDGARPAA
ncbi:MAG: hypothetical protein AAF678_03495 [Pseudomonadota bacterium]